MYHIVVLINVFKVSYSVKFICSLGKESKMFSCTEGQESMFCKSKKILRIHSKMLPLGSAFNVVQKMCHIVDQRRKIKKVVLPVEEFNED